MFFLNKKITQKFSDFITRGVLGVFVVVTLLGIFGCMCQMTNHQEMPGMGNHYDQSMTGCTSLTTVHTSCPMSITEHLNWWQNALLADTNFDYSVFFEIVLGISLAFCIFKARSHLARDYASRYRSYLLMHSESRLYNYFLRIFSQGILQPKLFA